MNWWEFSSIDLPIKSNVRFKGGGGGGGSGEVSYPNYMMDCHTEWLDDAHGDSLTY